MNSPAKGAKTASESDLSGLGKAADLQENPRRSYKRKNLEDDDMEILFNKFSTDLTLKLDTFKQDIDTKMTDFLTTMKNDLQIIKGELKSVSDQQTQLSEKHKALSARTDTVEKSCNSHKSDISSLNNQLHILQSELNIQQQRDRMQNLEISGIPDKSNENLTLYMINIAKYAGITITDQDIDHITRVQPRAKNSGRPKLVIAKLKTRLLKDSIISGIRNKKGVTTSDIGLSGEPKTIYVNEHLTPPNKLLYLQAKKKMKASAGFNYVWVRDGKIFARKSDNSPLILIRSQSDLIKIT
ncbi:hypothetical protein O0L34_g13762 [Tuta absoluta]|nr:hypothetical protein O0L34_g13762 [Tuta absoluta]